MAARQRTMQDYSAFVHHGTAKMWDDIASSPHLAMEIMCQRTNALGGINVSEPSCADITAAMVVAQYQSYAHMVPDGDLQKAYNSVKARLTFQHALAVNTALLH